MGESSKLDRTEATGRDARRALQGPAERVCDFVREHAAGKLGKDPSGEGFASATLPAFLELIDEDHQAMKEVQQHVNAFIDQHYGSNEELGNLKSESSPLPAMKA